MKLYNLFGKKRAWEAGDGGARRKLYQSYDEYVAHQRAKLVSIKNLDKKWAKLKSGLADRFRNVPQIKRGANGLCLGARLGAEVEVMIDMGVFAVGIDLNPGPDNRYVVTGDFHHIQYADASVDVIYTNSLDHVFDLDRTLDEIRRVLKPEGIFVADLIAGDSAGKEPGYFASQWWDNNDDMIDRIAKVGFLLVERHEFSMPWEGTQALFSPQYAQPAEAGRSAEAAKA